MTIGWPEDPTLHLRINCDLCNDELMILSGTSYETVKHTNFICDNCLNKKKKLEPISRQEAEKASEIRWACEAWEKHKKGKGIFLKHFGPISDVRCNMTELYVEARKWLEEYDKKI